VRHVISVADDRSFCRDSYNLWSEALFLVQRTKGMERWENEVESTALVAINFRRLVS
jgi:hypothetical protein